MAQLVRGAPGVYLQGLPTESVVPETAVTGFAGIAERGPLHVPQPVRTWDEFQLVFGGFVDYGMLPHEVFGFFRNGGTRCVVVRVADTTDASAENRQGRCPRVDLLRAAINTVAPDPLIPPPLIKDFKGNETIQIAAINPGRWGNRVRFLIQAGSQRHMPLTTVGAAAAAGATTITVREPFDLKDGMSIRLALPGSPAGGHIATVQSVLPNGVVTLTAALATAIPRDTVVLGRGFKITIRLDGRAEVFDNLSMAPGNSRYFVRLINGPDDTVPYIDRQARGHSIVVRVTHLTAGGVSHFTPDLTVTPAPPLADPNVLSGGGDGFRYSRATFKDAGGNPSIPLVARAVPANPDSLGLRGNGIRVVATAYATKTALAAAAGDTSVFLENVTGLIVGDPIVITSGVTETRTIAAIGADNKVDVTGGLTNAYPREAAVTIAGRFTLSVFLEPLPIFTTLAVAAAIGDSTVVVDNAIGIAGGRLAVTTLAGDVSESYPIVSVGAGNVVTLNVAGGLVNAYPLGSLVTVTPSEPSAREPVEVHRNLSGDPLSARYFRPRLAADSKLLCGDGPTATLQPPVDDVRLVAGRDPGNIDFRWYTGYDVDGRLFTPAPNGPRLGLATLDLVDEIDLVSVPDLAAATLLPAPTAPVGPEALYLVPHRQVLRHAAAHGDRFALLDMRHGTGREVASELPRQIADPTNGQFGALYYPWLAAVAGPEQRMVPPSGWVAGLVARADRTAGVLRAPANFPFKDVVDVEHELEAADQDTLNPASVNVIRKFELPALELWGARTLSVEPAARYVSVRRLVLALKKALSRRLLWVAFEPNGPALQRRIQASLQSLLETLVAGGATAGSAGAFFVKCDAENNPPELEPLGQVVATIGVALAAPAEFIVLNIKRTPDAVSVTEEAQ